MRTPTLRIIQAIAFSCVVTAVPASAQQAPSTVTLERPDGITLKATYYSPGKPGPGVVLLHQCNRDREAWAPFARAAASRGYHVIAMDYRGYGDSEGQRFESPQEQGPVIAAKWPGDVDAAYDWLVSQSGVDRTRIAAAGASCGVNQSVLLASRHPEVRTVILLSGNLTPPAREYLSKAAGMPVLAAASRDDGGAVESMQWILGWSHNPSNRLVEYQHAGHGTDMFAAEQGLQPLMLNWLDTNLRDAPAASTAPPPAGPPSQVETFWTTLTQPGGPAKARALFDEARRKDAKVVLFPENEMNLQGYELLQQGSPEDAIIVFQMNVDAYPGSANTYDSLSDAYLAAGKREQALTYAEKAIQMLDTDRTTPEDFKTAIRESAQRKITELKK